MMVCVCLGEAVEVGAVASSSMGWCEATDETYPLQHLEHGVERGEEKCEVKLQLHKTKYPLGMAQRQEGSWEAQDSYLGAETNTLPLSLRSNPALALCSLTVHSSFLRYCQENFIWADDVICLIHTSFGTWVSKELEELGHSSAAKSPCRQGRLPSFYAGYPHGGEN